MKARIQNGFVVEILTPVAGFTIDQCFHADIIAQCVDVSEGMKVGDVYPPVVEAIPVVVEETPVVEEPSVVEETPPDTTT
jgi:hypothetical protein